jgi:hypothetical protein
MTEVDAFNKNDSGANRAEAKAIYNLLGNDSLTIAGPSCRDNPAYERPSADFSSARHDIFMGQV